MKVGELKKLLKKYDNDLLVVLSKDGEGNGYDTLYQIDDNASFAGRDEVGLRELTPELKEQGYSEEDLLEGDPCIIIYP